MEPKERSGDYGGQGGEEITEMRKGPWTMEEDLKLINSIAMHGPAHWSYLARSAGLKRTGKSCRLRWLNYLHPDVKRGNLTLQEQLLILQLHSHWGNRWSKIAQYLPGRTDNEIKNYWRTRVQKLAKQLNCNVNSTQFRDSLRYLWLPRLAERVQSADSTQSSIALLPTSTAAATTTSSNHTDYTTSSVLKTGLGLQADPNLKSNSPEYAQDLTYCHDIVGGNWIDGFQEDGTITGLVTPSWSIGYHEYEGFGSQILEDTNNGWIGGDSFGIALTNGYQL